MKNPLTGIAAVQLEQEMDRWKLDHPDASAALYNREFNRRADQIRTRHDKVKAHIAARASGAAPIPATSLFRPASILETLSKSPPSRTPWKPNA